MRADDRVLSEPSLQIAVGELADSSVNLVVRPWVDAADYWERGNSSAGAVLSISHDVPRWRAEQLVGEAVRRLEEDTINDQRKTPR